MSGVDVTAVRDTEARLRESEERYRSVVESVGDTVFQADLRGRWLFLNESWARWTGVPVAHTIGRQAWELVHPDDRAAHTRAFAPLLAGEVDSVHLRHRYVTAEDVTRWAEVRASLARDNAGRPLGIAGVIEDITEDHRTRQYEVAERAVVDVLGAAIDVEDGVPVLLAALCRSLDWDLAELWTVDAEREVLHCTDAWGERPHRPRNARGDARRRGVRDRRRAARSGVGAARADLGVRPRGRPAVPARRDGRGGRRAVRARDADRARRRDARRDPVLLARAARPRSEPRPAAAARSARTWRSSSSAAAPSARSPSA